MPINSALKLAFCHIPRTGGVSVCQALNMTAVDRHLPVSWLRLHYPDYFLFTVLRSREDRVRSTVGWKAPVEKGHHDLEKYVAMVMGRDDSFEQGLMLMSNEYFLDGPVDYTIRFESLQADLDRMMDMRGWDKVTLPHLNSFK